ncbi:hypothetical protein [Rhodoplanes sp. Z2-YC6860]|uniref:hypothetical protein n=1 Tax=Rhodoplanes sp. Z2-YC6860 TaxID=674703 RepID=UPI000830B0D9|nr:hypothetical protein [Rhodoplanes sp. Z2-YC6860]
MRIARFVTGSLGSPCLCHLALVLLLLPLIALLPDRARADDADTAVQLFVAAGQAAGLPITDTEATVVTQIVRCGVANQQDVGDCVKNAAIKAVLQQVLPAVTDPQTANVITGAVTCITGSNNPAGCAAQVATNLLHLPADAQPAVNCLVAGGNVADCSKKLAEGMLVDKLPPQIQGAAVCALEGGSVQKCATDFITKQVVQGLPPNLQGPASQIVGCLGDPNVPNCVKNQVGNLVGDQIGKQLGPNVGQFYSCATQSGANVGQCAANFASAAVPALPGTPPGTDVVAKATVACITAPDAANCINAAVAGSKIVAQNPPITQDAINQINTTIATIQKLRPDSGPAPIDASPNASNQATLKNIIMVADGIKTGNWGEVVTGGGTEMAIMAGDIILSVFLTPEVAKLLGPAVAAMIHNDEAAAQQAIDAIGKGDPVALAQVLFTWYETQFIDKPCALLGDSAAVNTVCGDMSKAIQQISTWGGDIAHALLGVGEDILKWLGVWGTVDTIATDVWNTVKGAIDDIGHFLGLGSDSNDWKPAADCGGFSPKDYFANNYIACVPAAAQVSGSPALNASIGSMNSACEQAFDRCIPPDKRGSVASTCAAFGNSLSDVANQVSAAMGTAADLYTSTIGPASYISQQFQAAQDAKFLDTPDFCSANFWDASAMSVYAGNCGAFVNKQFPNTTPAPAACLGIPSARGAVAACFHSISQFASAGAGQTALVGPGSTYCNAQTKWINDHHCHVVTGKPQIFTGSGKDITLTPKSWQCDSDVLIKFPGDQVSIPILVPPKSGSGSLQTPPWARGIGVGKEISILGGAGVSNPPVSSSGISTSRSGDPKIPVTFPAPGEGGHGPVVIPPPRPGLPLGAPPMKPPITAGLPKGGGGSSGISMVNGCSGNAPAAGCPPATKSGSGGGKSGGSSGISMVNGNTNSSTTKSGTSKGGGGSSGISMVNGNTNSSTTKSKSGGSSGVSMINGNSGNAPRLSPGFKDTPRAAPIITARPPVSSSGTNSAMDRLGGGSIGSVSGGGGGSAARRSGFGAGTGSSSTFKTIPVVPRNDPNDLHVH